jgi:DMSO/TMAO reductase YedYZ molybdopterin-dependent catalytic subunit
MTRSTRSWWAAASGVAAVLVTLATAELLALILAPASSPLLAAGSAVIDNVPPFVKETAIALFGTNDKAVLIACLGLLVVIVAGAAGFVEHRRAPWGIVVFAASGAIAFAAVMTRTEATAAWAIPTVVGVGAGLVVLRVAITRLARWAGVAPAVVEADARTERNAFDRRSFLSFVGGASAVAIVVGLGARLINVGRAAVNVARKAITLPTPALAAAPIPAGAMLDVAGITPLVSDNATFYRIDTALQIPTIDTETWRLRITGMVENEVEISFADLLALPMVESYVTLMCVSNEVGGGLTGNALWLGHPLRNLIAQAKPLPGADMVLSTSADGWTASTPLEILQDENRNSLLAVGMNGEPLPLEHGFPVRMVVPGLYGYVSATKWVVELKLTRFADETAFWTNNGWSAKGPVKTSSRIDVPTNGASVAPGLVAIAGMAWAQHTGVAGMEVRVDGGAWQAARLADELSIDTWRQWVFDWDATSGNHLIEARAIDAAGGIQSGVSKAVAPDGAEGWQVITVSVG